VLRPLFNRLFVVANDPEPWRGFGLDVVPDRRPGLGPLGGIEAALTRVVEQGADDRVVCVAGDLPFLSAPLLAALRDGAPDAVALAPRRRRRIEPLCARYGAALLPLVTSRALAGELALHRLLEEAGARWIEDAALAGLDPRGLSFFNVNGPEDLRRADEIAQEAPP
jgi:molybdenum cofactor guanylyltransferase